MTVLTLSIFLAQIAVASDQYASFADPVTDLPEPMLEDPFGADPLSTPGGSSFAQQEMSMDQELQNAGGDDFLYPASSTASTPDEIEAASSYASDVIPPSRYPRSELGKKFDKFPKKNKFVKQAQAKKTAKKKAKKTKKIAHHKQRSRK